MIKTIIYKRGPEHEVLWEGEMPAVPREGETLSLDSDQAAFYVHSVTHMLEDGEWKVALVVK